MQSYFSAPELLNQRSKDFLTSFQWRWYEHRWCCRIRKSPTFQGVCYRPQAKEKVYNPVILLPVNSSSLENYITNLQTIWIFFFRWTYRGPIPEEEEENETIEMRIYLSDCIGFRISMMGLYFSLLLKVFRYESFKATNPIMRWDYKGSYLLNSFIFLILFWLLIFHTVHRENIIQYCSIISQVYQLLKLLIKMDNDILICVDSLKCDYPLWGDLLYFQLTLCLCCWYSEFWCRFWKRSVFFYHF